MNFPFFFFLKKDWMTCLVFVTRFRCSFAQLWITAPVMLAEKGLEIGSGVKVNQSCQMTKCLFQMRPLLCTRWFYTVWKCGLLRTQVILRRREKSEIRKPLPLGRAWVIRPCSKLPRSAKSQGLRRQSVLELSLLVAYCVIDHEGKFPKVQYQHVLFQWKEESSVLKVSFTFFFMKSNAKQIRNKTKPNPWKELSDIRGQNLES